VATRVRLGDIEGLDEQRHALELAVERGSGRDAAIFYNNLVVDLEPLRGPATALEVTLEGIAFSERRGSENWRTRWPPQASTI
jgi:hypothetical protein